MKYPCAVIRDLLPLYCDQVCSQESRQMVEEHLQECQACRKLFEEMKETEQIPPEPVEEETEEKKAAAFRRVRKRLRQKQVLVGICSLVLGIIAILLVSTILRHTVRTVEYQDNIQVAMEEDGLISQLEGTRWYVCSSVTLETQVEGQTRTCLFFYYTDTAWDDLVTGSGVYSRYTLCPADKGAEKIDAVYYYTGDYSRLSTMSPQELETVINSSVLLWSK